MTDYYLRAPDADTMRAVLDALPAEGVTIDEIGFMQIEVAEEVYEPVPGYFANVRSELELEFPGVELMNPVTPWRVFA